MYTIHVLMASSSREVFSGSHTIVTGHKSLSLDLLAIYHITSDEQILIDMADSLHIASRSGSD